MMYFYNLIKDIVKDKKTIMYVDMDGVIAAYDFGNPLDFANKRPLYTNIKKLEEISKLCGEKKSKDKDKTASTPLVTVSDLQKMKMNEAIILHTRLSPFKTKMKPSYEIDWGNNFPRADFTERKKGEIGLFDLKEFVNNKRKENAANGMGGMPNGMMGGGFNPNPFDSNPFDSNPFASPNPFAS